MTLDDLVALKAAHSNVSTATNRMNKAARKARANGATWAEIGKALGITPQAAQKRYGNGEERASAGELLQARNALRRAKRQLERLQQSEPESE